MSHSLPSVQQVGTPINSGAVDGQEPDITGAVKALPVATAEPVPAATSEVATLPTPTSTEATSLVDCDMVSEGCYRGCHVLYNLAR